MTPAAPGSTADALDPVRAELLSAAHADAEALSARAATDAAAVLDRARDEAAAILDEARRQGEADGAAASRDLLRAARREARARVLSARREAYGDLRRAIAVRTGELRRTDDYAELRERLEGLARALLGPGAEVTEHPEGGVVARAPGRRLDLSLTALADRALDRLGGEVRVLWEP
ncbi:hypothetical protein P1P68_17190 [Streptomyces scabiei]|uniref:hypothetical protein n=1 Tax=Streptomyces scabiei TaxID=1930 RepID=UPI00298F70F1|nr:hypothetical protein [Streptomyces scabiei]MDW8806477.1 hypothetical protein [Streptomyces scabiei]